MTYVVESTMATRPQARASLIRERMDEGDSVRRAVGGSMRGGEPRLVPRRV